MGGDGHRQAQGEALAFGGQPGEQVAVVELPVPGGLGRGGVGDHRGHGLVQGAGIGPDRGRRRMEQVGVVDHAGLLSHVLAE